MNPIIDGIIALEGGYVFNPKDKGGATHWGITEATARAHGYAGDPALKPTRFSKRITG